MSTPIRRPVPEHVRALGPLTAPTGGTLEAFRRAQTPGGREADGRFVIEGTRLHERALRAGARVEQALVAEELALAPGLREEEVLGALARSGTRLHAVGGALLEEFTASRELGGIVGLVPLPPTPALADALHARGLLLVAVDVAEPGNVGALVRTALAAGASGMVAVGTTDPWHPKAVRTSMGSLFKLPILRCREVRKWLDALARTTATLVAATSRGGLAPAAANLGRRPLLLHVGSESRGLPDTILGLPVERVSIPMTDALDSYSIHAAAAILLYEAVRQG